MMALDLHTPLESFLLFQNLHPFSGDPVFNNVSESLKSNDLIREKGLFEADRLEPDALRTHYLQLLKEEAKVDFERLQTAHTDIQEVSREREPSSPLLETVDQARDYAHLLPQLVNRLYFRYRDSAIQAIKDEERKFRLLEQSVRESQTGRKDPQVHSNQNTGGRDSRSSIQTLLWHEDEAKVPSKGDARPDALQEPQIANDVQSQADLRDAPKDQASRGDAVSQNYSQGETMQTHSSHQHPRPPILAESKPPFPPHTPYPHHGYQGSPNAEIHRRLPPPNQSQPPVAPLPSPRSNQPNKPPPKRSSGSPIILPPVPGMLRSSGSPAGPLDTLADMAGQQKYRASPTMPSPRALHQQGSQQHPPQLPPPPNYVPRPPQFYENPSPYPIPFPPSGQGPLPAYNQYPTSMQPYQGPQASPAHSSHYGNMPPVQAPLPPYQGYTYPPGYYQPPPMQTPYVRGPVPRFSDQRTPISTPSEKQRPPKPSPIFTSASSTRWKSMDAPGSVPGLSPTRPGSRDISPLSDKSPSPSPEVFKTVNKNSESQRNQQNEATTSKESVPSKPTRAIQARTIIRKGPRARAGSVASSTIADSIRTRTRSLSTASQVDELSLDNQPLSTRRIKPEPSTASAHEDDTSVASHDDSTRKPTRNRRRAPHNLETLPETPHPNTKRKRRDSPPSVSASPTTATAQPTKPGFILGTRNFPRTSTTLMNDIISHKVAGIFAKPLTDREAPGYRDLIYRPQDLKSIKSAISAGSRALNAAIENLDDEDAVSSSSSSVWIPETPDVVPPKGIVNSAQLEKELMRMFANAIMFNVDVPSKRGLGPYFRKRMLEATTTTDLGTLAASLEDLDEEDEEEHVKGKEDVSVVKDTREIFEGVQKSVGDWRSAEKAVVVEEENARGSGGGGTKTSGGAAKMRGGGGGGGAADTDVDAEEEADELAGDDGRVMRTVEEESTEPKAKRRRR